MRVAGGDGVESGLLNMFGGVEVGLSAGEIDDIKALGGQLAALLHHQRRRAARH